MNFYYYFIGASLVLTGLLISGCSSSRSTAVTGECQTLCQAVAGKCNQLDVVACAKDCAKWDDAKKECFSKAQNCAELEQTCAWQANTPATTGRDCTSACNNYVAQCISQVPNATDALRQEAFESCSSDCQKWPESKVGCIAGCKDCPSMTEDCSL